MTNAMAKLRGEWKKPAQITMLSLIFIALALFPRVVSQTVYVRYGCNILMYATLAGSLNVINGYSGQMCLGQAGFFAVGAYTCAILGVRYGISFWLCLPLAGLLGALVGYVV
ncbi:MAG: branched-chain amino acid ABC transporter permease, partial [Christensenellaceae bacterium]|nr:branched-chain amino acid ABC transporter permease [Christensenellaceae bacterium]